MRRSGRPVAPSGSRRRVVTWPSGGARAVRLGGLLFLLLGLGTVVVGPVTAGAAGQSAPRPGWTWPLTGSHAVSRPYAPPPSRYGAGHRGVDLVGTAGQPVLAAGAGRVAYAGMLAGRGVVVVSHGVLRTTYEPVIPVVAVGARVEAGAALGRLAPAHLGCTAAACLHWGLRRGADYLDPMALLRRPVVVLLPWDGATGNGALAAGDRPGATAFATAGTRIARLPAAAPRAARPGPGATLGAASRSHPSAAARRPRRPRRPSHAGRSAPSVEATPPPAAARLESAGPEWALRGSDLPLGAAAVLALVVGLVLLIRPGRPPDRPRTGSGAGARTRSGGLGPPDVGAVFAQPLDLAAERLRRRAG